MGKLSSPSDLEQYRDSLLRAIDPNRTCVRICMTGCRAYGAEEIRDAFRSEVAKRGLESKVEIRETGCHGFCARAPVIAIDPSGIFYQQLTPGDVPEIISETIEQQKIIERLTYLHPLTDKRIAEREKIPFYQGQIQNVLKNCGKSIREVLTSILPMEAMPPSQRRFTP